MPEFDIRQLMYEQTRKLLESGAEFNGGKNYLEYQEALTTIRDVMNVNHTAELSAILEDANAANYIKFLIARYIREYEINVAGMESLSVLVNAIYDSMAGFDFLTEYIYRDDVEEINGNAWDDIEIVTERGWEKVGKHFASPQQCSDIVKKMMQLGGVIIDGQRPTADSYITRGVRISAIIPPCVDEDCGAVFSIRKQRNIVFTREQLLDFDTATAEELDFLELCLNHGVSVGLAGATGSGKTADIAYLLSRISRDKRIFTIEDTRELNNIIQKDGTGAALNRVIHTKTRQSDNPKHTIDTDTLLKRSLRFHPDILVPAEMRGEEAMTAQEAGRTGHTVLATLHASTALAAYTRILTMCMMSGTKLSEELMLKLIIEAFPIIAFKVQLPDGSRKYMRVIEAEDYADGRIVCRTLFSYAVEGRRVDPGDGRIERMIGRHVRGGRISHALADRLLEHGADIGQIRRFAEADWRAHTGWDAERAAQAGAEAGAKAPEGPARGSEAAAVPEREGETAAGPEREGIVE
ncbi:MAG: Flp pilus assembly complex ATPase component TadA [Clostridiales bacterium]|jgi:pilus assembly protein CpaF|nr:Flp pilus assembly complex ATPase component TadA [Clostridiales bacterium]